ncbi:MAG TPA: hypothetical protein VFW83_08380 [Bryobacteraceae bacterium]|nr:hypothetical protein [Bryobacteraceae bacterium]
MATLANVWSKLAANGMEQNGEATRRMETSARVRAFANEDILFYVKRIDNSRVVRAADPAGRRRCWKLAGVGLGAAILLICVLLPSAYGILAGYQIQTLKTEGQRLSAEQASLEIQEAGLLSPARIEQLANEQQFADPAPESVVYLNNRQGSLAMNGK